MIWCISVCSMIGGISVSVTTGLGAAIVTSSMGDNQVMHRDYSSFDPHFSNYCLV
jgi:magnesium transporter